MVHLPRMEAISNNKEEWSIIQAHGLDGSPDVNESPSTKACTPSSTSMYTTFKKQQYGEEPRSGAFEVHGGGRKADHRKGRARICIRSEIASVSP